MSAINFIIHTTYYKNVYLELMINISSLMVLKLLKQIKLIKYDKFQLPVPKYLKN